jgi:membrane protein required for colicin V production
MFVDFGIVLPIIFGGLIGFRDGSVRKLVSIIVTFGAMYAAKFFMYDLAGLMQRELSTDPAWAPLHAYLIIFSCILVLQALLYRFLTDRYKIGGPADRIGGAVLGLVHTSLVISVILTIFAMKGIPSESSAKESRSYESVRGVAMQLLNLVTETVPNAADTIDKLRQQGIPGGTKDTSGTTDTSKSVGDKLRDMIDKSIQEQAKEAQKLLPSAQDSLLKTQKKQ